MKDLKQEKQIAIKHVVETTVQLFNRRRSNFFHRQQNIIKGCYHHKIYIISLCIHLSVIYECSINNNTTIDNLTISVAVIYFSTFCLRYLR